MVHHYLTGIDEEQRTATCSECGPGTRVWKGGHKRVRWRCAKRVGAQVSRRRDLDPIRTRVRKLRGNGIDITLEQYLALVQTADGRCQLCSAPTDPLCVDHDHQTGRARGLLCSTCNTGLGKFGDDPERLEAAAAYIRG